MTYEAQMVQLARCAKGHHGKLKEVVFLSKDAEPNCLLVFADGTVIGPNSDASLTHEYGKYAGYGEIAGQLGGTHPYSLLAFGYQGTGPSCFTTFLQAAGFSVSLSDLETISPPVRVRANGSRVTGTGRPGSVEWEDHQKTPAVTLR